MEFRILGPLEVASEERIESIASAKERALLCLLVLDANRVVSSERLIDQLWDGSVPDSAATSLRVLVSRLRKTLARFDDHELVVTRAPGYLLHVGAGELDAARFDALTARGRSLFGSGDAEGAARTLREALDLWRGPALADVDGLAAAEAARVRLEESRLAALEDRVEADLAAGRHGPLTAELESLTRANPLRERLWSQRMLALYRAGRQADALRVYQDLRSLLGEELGIEPSPEVVRLETAIVRQDESLALVAPVAARTTPGQALPSGVVTLLLTDIEGSTPLWESKPAAMADALTRHDDLLRTIVAAHGGSLLRARGEGDSTFSVFARATDAAEAALEAQDALSREPWPARITLRVRMALHTGETVEREGDYYGTAVNRAARLRGVALPGQIVVSQSTAEVIVDHLEGAELVELGEQSLRGLTRPERLFELRPKRRSTEAVTHEVASVPLPAPIVRTVAGVFVARDVELARITSIWKELEAGQPHLVLIAGEAGIGKTRLAAEFATSVHGGGATILFGRCDEDGGEPYQPFAEALRAYVAAAPAAATLGGSHLARLLPDLGLGAAPSLGDADAERRALFDAVARVLGEGGTSVVLFIDDLHWADGPTLLMLRHLLRADVDSPVMVVATYRDTDVDRSHPLSSTLADLRRETNLTRIALSGLDVDGVVAYVEATAGQELDERERGLANVVYEQTEGNPFFIVEVLRHFVETGAVYRSEGRWHTDITSTEDAGLPEGVRDVITRRLDRLPEIANRALATAAVVGPEFSLAVVSRVLDDAGDDELLDALEQSVRAGVINESAPGQYLFTHALIRQTLYDELTSTRRARLHRRVGEAIEAFPGADVHVEALAHHFAEAALDGQIAKAVDYALAAGFRSMERAAIDAACKHFERGMQLIELDAPIDYVRRAALGHALATARWATGDRAGAVPLATRAARDAVQADDNDRLARVAMLLAGMSELGVKDETIEAMCHEALGRLGAADRALRARVLAALGRYLAFAAGDSRTGAALTGEAVTLVRDVAEPTLVMGVLNARILALQGLGESHEQLALANELLELSEEHANDRAHAEGLVARCQAHLELGERDALEVDIATLEGLGTATQWWLPRAFAATFRSGLATCDGRFDDAQALDDESTELARGSLDIATAMAAGNALRLILTGNVREAMEFVHPYAMVNQSVERALLIIEANMHVIEGNFEAAGARLDEVVSRHDDMLAYDPIFPICLAQLIEAAARVQHLGICELFEPVIASYHGLLLPVGRGGGSFGAADRYAAMVAATQQRWSDAEALYESALALETRMRSAVFLAHTRLWYGRMLLERDERNDRDRARQVLREALTASEDLGLSGVAHDAANLLAHV
jgi:DNA-binding SARP family transcriptional activator